MAHDPATKIESRLLGCERGSRERTHELGIRAALGATTGNLLGLVLRHGLALTGTGMVVGLIAAFAATPVLRAFLFGVGSSDPITFGVTAGILSSVATLACYIPARAATRVDPLSAIRAE